MKLRFVAVVCVFAGLACGGSKASDTKSTPSASGEEFADREATSPDAPDGDESETDSLEVEGLRGTMEQDTIQAGVQPHLGRLTNCFAKHGEPKRFVGGTVEIKFEVARDGSLKWVQIAKSDLGSWPVEKCLLGVARAMKFGPPRGGDADFTLPLEFPATRDTYWWEEDRGEREAAAKRKKLAKCPKSGEVSNALVTVYVGTRGRVESVGFSTEAEKPFADEWADCAAKNVSGWTLSDPRGKIAKMSFVFSGN